MKAAIANRFWAFFLALAVTAGALGCLLTVYPLPLSKPSLVGSLLAAALFGILVLPLRRGSELTLALCALALGYLLHRPETVRQIKSFLYDVSTFLDGVYHWGYFAFPGLKPGNTELPLCIYGCGLCLAVCRSVLRRRTSLVPILLAAPPVALCAMVQGKNPESWAVACLLFGAGMLLLTSGARKNGALQGLRLTFAAALPVLACVGVLLLCNPQERYVDRSAPVREAILAKFRGGSGALSRYAFVPQVDRSRDLAALSGGEQPRMPVLTVTAPENGGVYLRGQDFDTYTGRGWMADPARSENFDGWGEEKGTFSVKTFAVQDLIYLPYYPGTGTILTGGALPNTGGTTSYTFPNRSQGSALPREALEIYLSLPESTLAWAKEILPDSADPATIEALVEGSAVYDLKTPQMPEGETDFARWFWEQSDRGYCVHFASLATVLLRAAGIPARYVTGYRQEVSAGKPTVVTSQEAHAWAEYYDGERGCWKILEATPGREISADGSATAPEPDADRPHAETPAQEEPPAGSETAKAWLPVWLVLPGVALVLAARRALVRLVREGRKRRSPARKRILLLWQEAEDLSEATGKPIPDELLELAQRAKFSQHRITAMDAVPLETFCQECRERLQKAPFWKKLINRYLYVRD